MIKVLQRGMLTTLQDLGRRGYQRFGVPVSGAMDSFAARLANSLVGNAESAALIEFTVMGPVLEMGADCHFALTGGRFAARLSGEPVPMNRCVFAPAGSRLETGVALLGARGYLAVGGGFDVPADMGSVSTYPKAGLGGLDGGPLQNGDLLPVGQAALPEGGPLRAAPDSLLPPYGPAPTVRVVAELSTGFFADGALAALTAEPYTVSGDSDRMGCRLIGPDLPYAAGCDGNTVSDGIALGSIQVAGGKPIILMADRQTTGGYTKIGAVITADLPLVAQLKPGDTLRFAAVSLPEAQAALRAQRAALSAFAATLSGARR